LTVPELCHALAVQAKNDELGKPEAATERDIDEDYIPDIEDILSVCAGLLAVDKESNVVRLVHFTTQEYFEQIRENWSPNAQETIASTCLTYLTFSPFTSGSCKNNDEYIERLERYPFLIYAAQCWGHHAKDVEEAIMETAKTFLSSTDLCSNAGQV